jgi:F-type H+-transporting ATPase subunit b
MQNPASFLLFLDSAAASSSSSSGNAPFTAGDFLDKLIPNFWSFLINFLALIVLFVALYFIAYKPIKKYVNARKDYVEHNVHDSEVAKTLYEKKAAESDAIIADAKAQANDIIAKAKADAAVAADRIVQDAQSSAKARQQAADEAIRQAEEKSQRAIHDEIVNVALEASRQVLGREVNQEDNAKLVSDFADDIVQGKEG